MTTPKDKKQLGHKFCLQIHTILQTQKSYLVSSILKTLGIIKSDSCSAGANVTKILKNPMDQLRALFLPPPKHNPPKSFPIQEKFLHLPTKTFTKAH
jgi:hypothetical protein